MREILKKLKNNEISVEDAEKILKSNNKYNNIMEIASLANFDTSRQDRTGFPEAVLAEGKDDDDLIAIISAFCNNDIDIKDIGGRCCRDNHSSNNSSNQDHNSNSNSNFNNSSIINNKLNNHSLIITRLKNDRYDNLKNNINSSIMDDCNNTNYTMEYNKKARILIIRSNNADYNFKSNSNPNSIPNSTPNSNANDFNNIKYQGNIGIISAGTSDIPYAEEARIVCEESGFDVITSYDVGVAGIHRLFPKLANMVQENVKILLVFAGMEGALPSVVAGLVDIPVIGVPTSVGYGVGGKGKTALYAMLQSCAPGIAVVNIDNGFGAAAFAIKMIKNLEGK
ncbi:MAG: nickel pincer cofactor biosynthesis protein LarB [Methanobacteriaceae archaeon]